MRRRFAWTLPIAAITWALALLTSGASAVRAADGGAVDISLSTSTESLIEFVVTFGDPRWSRVTGPDGTEWRVASFADTRVVGNPGDVGLLAYTAMVGIPANARVVGIEAEPIGVTVSSGPPLAPVPTPNPHPTDPTRVGSQSWLPGWERGAAIAPQQWASHQHTTWVRSRRVSVVHVFPLRTQPGSDRVSSAEAVRVRVRLAPLADEARDGSSAAGTAKTSPTRFDRDPAARVLDARLVNGGESREWLRGERPARRLGQRGGGSYFDSGSTWVRLRTDTEGIVRVTGTALEGAGVSLSSIDPSTIRLFGGSPFVISETPPAFTDTPPWMREFAISVDDGGDGTFEAGDRVEFFGTPIDGFADQLDESGGPEHVDHLYAKARTYWLTWGGTFGGAPMRMSTFDAVATGSATSTWQQVPERLHIEENTHYSAREYNETDRWERWWWNSGYRMSDGGFRGVIIQVPGHVPGTPATLVTRFWGSTAGRHLMDMRSNSIPQPRQDWIGFAAPHDAVLSFDAATDPFLEGRNTFTFRVDPSDDLRNRDEILLAYFELNHQRALNWPGEPFTFESPDVDETLVYAVNGLPASGTDVYDVTIPSQPIRLVTGSLQSGTIEFERTEAAGVRRRYLIGNTDRRVEPSVIELDTAPSVGYLRNYQSPVDYIVVYADNFGSPARALAEFRSTLLPGVDNPQALAVRVSDVFDEFSWGIEDPTAIRNFIKWAYEHYRDPSDLSTPRLTYASLLGDADFDHRDRETSANDDLIPAWSGRFDRNLRSGGWNPTWPEDAYMGLLEGPDEFGLDVIIGRMPAKTIAEASAMVNKTIEHAMSPVRGDWQRRVVLVADDLCQGTSWDGGFYRDWTHIRQAERMVDVLPVDTEVERVYLVDYPDPVNGVRCLGGDKPSSRDALLDAVNRGVWLVDYVGHGGETVMADERVLVSADIPQMTNAGRYHYFVTASCTVGKFDDIGEGLAETVLKHEGGGSVNSYSAAAVAFSGSNARLNLSLLDNTVYGNVAVPDSVATFGAAAALALLDIDELNTRRYNVLGDPANTMVRAAYDVDLTLRAADGSAVGDSLWRSERLTIVGRIVDPNTRAVQPLSGVVSLRAKDSEEFRERQPTPDYNPKNYYLPGATMFRGNVPVVDGEFTASFVVPSGLRRGSRGAARLRAYFSGTAGGTSSVSGDGVGSLDSLFVPNDIRPAFALTDSTGPAISLTWAGPVAAVPAGSSVGVSLSDAEGIYITQLLDSRAAVVTFEDESGFVFEVVDLAPQIEFDGSGMVESDVTVPIPSSLPVNRPYVVRVRASDNLGNRSAAEQSIYLVSSGGIGVQRVFAYPNPATSTTGIFVDASRELVADLRVYTVGGRLIRTIEARLAPGEGRSRPLTWNLRDDDGDTVANGSYHYLIRLSPTDGSPVEERRGWVAVLR